jgi:dynein heavy chain
MPYNTLWNLAREYFYKISTWMTGPIIDFDREKIMREITDACQTLIRMEKVDFKDKKATALVCNELRKLYDKFKPFLPLIVALRNPSLKLRHWDNIKKLKKPDFEIDYELHVSI